MHNDTWEKRAACAPQNLTKSTKDLDWFSSDKDIKYHARATCQNSCPVRRDCLQSALDNQMIHGIWGGADDYELRRALSVDANGDALQRNRVPRCPFCIGRRLNIAGQKTKQGYYTECLDCGLAWNMAIIPQKLKGKKAA